MGSHRKSKTTTSSHQHKNSLSNPFSNHSHDSTQSGDNHCNNNSVNNSYASDIYDDDFDDDDGMDFAPRTLDFSKVLQDVEGSLVGTMTSSVLAVSQLLTSTPSAPGRSFRVTWKELIYLVLAIVVLAALSIFLGVAAGITISIHYFDTHSTPSFPRLEARERDLGPHQRVTTLDYNILSSNILHPVAATTTTPDEKTLDLTLGRVITMSETGQRSVLLVVEESPPLQTTDKNTTARKQSPPISIDNNHTASLSVLNGLYTPFRHIGPPDNKFRLSASSIHPTICADGVTIGFNDWYALKAAVEEANALSAERFMKWNEYFASLDVPRNASFTSWFDNLPNDDGLDRDDLRQYYYYEVITFTVCPGSTLKGSDGPIFVNAENIVIECGDPEEHNYIQASQPDAAPSTRSSFSRERPTCTLDVSGTHLAFGPHARNVLVRGLVFQSAKTSSLAFHYDGAQASFEDCVWIDNAGVHGRYGAVADVNSSSSVNFYRCEIGSSLASVANFATSGSVGGTGDPTQSGMPAGTFAAAMSPGIPSFVSFRN